MSQVHKPSSKLHHLAISEDIAAAAPPDLAQPRPKLGPDPAPLPPGVEGGQADPEAAAVHRVQLGDLDLKQLSGLETVGREHEALGRRLPPGRDPAITKVNVHSDPDIEAVINILLTLP